MNGCAKPLPVLRTTAQLVFLFVFVCVYADLNLHAGATGKVAGRISDKATGEGLPGANVVIVGSTLGAATDTDGNYVIINVPPGLYTLSYQYIGYAKTVVEKVRVSVDRTVKQDVQLSLEAISGEEVTIVAERPVVEMDRTHTAAIINAETVELMPVTEMSEVVALQAGVVKTGGALHFRGGRAREVAYIIDGVPVENAYSQGGGRNVTVENAMIEELEVISGTFSAEYGSAQSGIVNIVTKRPASKLSGSLQVYSGEWLSNKSNIFLDIDNFNPMAEKDIQVSLTGPIISDKLGFLVTGRFNDWESLSHYERRFNTIDGWRIAAYREWFQRYRPTESAQSQAIAIPDSLATGDLSRGPLSTGRGGSFTGKLSYFFSPQLTLTYQAFGSYGQSVGNSSGTYRYAPGSRGTGRGWAHSHFLKLRHVPSANTFYNLAFSYQLNDGESFFRKDNKFAHFPGDDGIQLFSSSASGFSLGSSDGFYVGKKGKGYRKVYSVNGDFNWQVDQHNFLKLGFIVKKHKINEYYRGFRSTVEWSNNAFPVGDVTVNDPVTGENRPPEFHEYWDFLQDYWRNWESNFDTTRFVAIADSERTQWRDYDIDPMEGAIYLQDKVEFGEIIINAGLRLDAFKPNERYPVNLRAEATNLGDDRNLSPAPIKYQLSPRLGISFPISDRGAFHASYGHFFQMPSFSKMFNEPLFTLTRVQLEGRRLGNAILEPEKTIAYEIGLQQGVTDKIAIDVTAYYKDFRNLLGIEMVNTIDAVGYTRFVNRDYGNSRGITVSVSTAQFGLLSGGINYTLSYANGSASNPESLQLIQTATQIGGEVEQFVDRKILPLTWDQRHTANAYVNISKAGDWSVGLVGFFNSNNPYTPSFIERFDISTIEFKNRATKPSRWSIDLKAKKHLTLGGRKAAIFLKVDNLFDYLNQEGVHSSTGRADEIARLPEDLQLELERLKQEGLFTLAEVDVSPGLYSSPRKVQVGMDIPF